MGKTIVTNWVNVYFWDSFFEHLLSVSTFINSNAHMKPGTDRFLVLIILVIFKKHIGHPLLQTENRCLTKLY